MICAYMCIIHTCQMIQVLGPPASVRAPHSGLGCQVYRPHSDPPQKLFGGRLLQHFGTWPSGSQCFEIVGLYLGLTNWAHNSPRWYQPPLWWVDVASNYLHPHVTSMRLVHEYHHLCKTPSIQALHRAAKLTNLTAYPPHSAQGRRTFTIHYWRAHRHHQHGVRHFQRSVVGPETEPQDILGNLENLSRCAGPDPYPFGVGVGGGQAWIIYYITIASSVVLSYIIYHVIYHIHIICHIWSKQQRLTCHTIRRPTLQHIFSACIHAIRLIIHIFSIGFRCCWMV